MCGRCQVNTNTLHFLEWDFPQFCAKISNYLDDEFHAIVPDTHLAGKKLLLYALFTFMNFPIAIADQIMNLILVLERS